ncbi:type III-B CRISPR module-associated Cmr3 family protein [Candidatus Accumulibacter cognatus]|uniref:CRISPR type III-B/RAMP module-associated protein Cmr3 n=1 Tax=Candidatus Accumulibacter cognatus TaxID=2954383 RepID=A0A080M5N6_9PROT|nr:type III-B CRISPR module-associated Cmr3 family protein [Candidatus Accumulibacter cognatus]KFB76592.1 MAG: CRISPR type III-B/RAMP module-associated protein Cmr3 [Candidatus Accumulibacter cognatus]
MNHDYLIEALAPLVFRSGKPFGAQAGADGAAFPLPSSLAGLLRTLHADQYQLRFSSELRQIATAGPLLARRGSDGNIVPLLPKPADALYLRQEGSIQVIRLSPGQLPPDTGCDLRPDLLPVRMSVRIDGKPAPGPQYWPFASLQSWSAGAPVAFETLRTQGLGALPAEERTHVALDDETLSADEGRLFQTGGIDLAAPRQLGGWQEHDLVFLARSDTRLNQTLATFGGERRISRLHPSPASHWPRPPDGLEAGIRAQGGLRLTLVTPGIFSGGHLPGWLDARTLGGSPPGCPDLVVTLKAVAVERWLPVSGWDLATQKPRAMRKAVAAGAVYWFELQNEPPPGLVETLWLQPVSDHVQDRLDGFGLALPASWNPTS